LPALSDRKLWNLSILLSYFFDERWRELGEFVRGLVASSVFLAKDKREGKGTPLRVHCPVLSMSAAKQYVGIPLTVLVVFLSPALHLDFGDDR